MEHQLQIQLVTKRNMFLREFFSEKDSKIVQTKAFEIGFLIKNIGNSPVKGFLIKNISWKAEANSQDIFEDAFSEFHIDTINPNEEKTIWVNKCGTYSYGLHSIRFTILPDVAEDRIRTYQLNSFTKEKTDPHLTNCWLDYFFVHSKNEYEQSRANTLLICFTVALFLTSILQFYLFWEYQIRPEIYKNKENNRQMKILCLNDLNARLVIDGERASCLDFLRTMNIATTTLPEDVK